jgi:hypothetical protein
MPASLVLPVPGQELRRRFAPTVWPESTQGFLELLASCFVKSVALERILVLQLILASLVLPVPGQKQRRRLVPTVWLEPTQQQQPQRVSILALTA